LKINLVVTVRKIWIVIVRIKIIIFVDLHSSHNFDAKQLMTKIDESLKYKHIKNKYSKTSNKVTEKGSLYLNYLDKAYKALPECKLYVVKSPIADDDIFEMPKTRNIKTFGR
jgi:RNA binding exosome subunit